ncbi:hypothetical protein YC2023_093635 [Brassica napus]
MVLDFSITAWFRDSESSFRQILLYHKRCTHSLLTSMLHNRCTHSLWTSMLHRLRERGGPSILEKKCPALDCQHNLGLSLIESLASREIATFWRFAALS